jgi:uncharacterized protein
VAPGSAPTDRGDPLRVRRMVAGEIVSYDDCMDPIAMAALLGRTPDLVAALEAT